MTRPSIMLRKIFSFCELDSSIETANNVCLWKNINTSRAFMHRWKRSEYDLDVMKSQYYDYEKLRKLDYVL